MPGRLVMDQHAVQGPDGLTKDLNSKTAQTNGSNFSPPMSGTDFADFAPDELVDSSRNGTKPGAPLANGSLQAQMDMGNESQPATLLRDQIPPELEKWSHTYVAMSVLYPRVAQQCYSDLVELVEVLAEIPVQGPPAVNGATNHDGPHNVLDKSAPSVDKKLRLMNFAHEQRNRFIKMLVLTEWARNMPAMDKLIELRMWLSKQDEASTLVADGMIRLKHDMIPAKMPNPNIQGALELLSTGKAPWMPDLGYIPPKRLNASQLLKTLKDMNFLMSVRLNIHEELPPQFRNYTVADGRATFVIPNEFEVDLALADDDPQSPFYFIDMRFLFSATRQIPEGPVRNAIEAKVNDTLANEGLSGCYSYLHDFVLTHRTNLLRRQAFALARSKWSEQIRVETVHRDFVVQYWTNRPGPKSWIHIGTVSNAKLRAESLQLSRPSRIGIRWMKEGQDCTIDHVELDNPHHSMENILEHILSSHIDQRLTAILDRIRALSGDDSILVIKVERQGNGRFAKSLEVQFGESRVPLKLRVSLVTGNIAISPVTAVTVAAETKLNSEPSLDPGQVIVALHCKISQNQIGKQALRSGWTRIPAGKQEDIHKMFGSDVVRWSVFVPKDWGSIWAVAVTISLTGERWWVVKLSTGEPSPTRSISSVEALPSVLTSTSSGRTSLTDIESKSVAQISFSNITAQLRQLKIQHELRQAQAVSTTDSSSIKPNTTVLCINFRNLMQPKALQLAKTWKPWCHDVLVLTHHGMSGVSVNGGTTVSHVLKASLTQPAASSLAKTVDNEDADISFSKDGALALRLHTKLGEDLVASIQRRLKGVERLYNYIRVAQQAGVSLEHTSVSRLVFKYQTEPALLVEIQFTDNPKAPVRVCLDAAGEGHTTNPHRRVQPLLQKLMEFTDSAVSGSGDAGEYQRFVYLLRVLSSTLPLLRGITALENAYSSTASVRGSVRGLAHYRLNYTEPFARVVFDIRLRNKNSRTYWLVTVSDDKKIHDAGLVQGLRELWSSKGEGWFGLSTGAAAEMSGVKALLGRLDALIRESGPPEMVQGNGEKTAEGKPEIVVLD